MGVKTQRITREQAIAIGRKVCAEQGWTCLEPVEARGGLFTWTVTTNGGRMGCTAWIKVRKRTGEVVGKGYVGR